MALIEHNIIWFIIMTQLTVFKPENCGCFCKKIDSTNCKKCFKFSVKFQENKYLDFLL